MPGPKGPIGCQWTATTLGLLAPFHWRRPPVHSFSRDPISLLHHTSSPRTLQLPRLGYAFGSARADLGPSLAVQSWPPARRILWQHGTSAAARPLDRSCALGAARLGFAGHAGHAGQARPATGREPILWLLRDAPTPSRCFIHNTEALLYVSAGLLGVNERQCEGKRESTATHATTACHHQECLMASRKSII